MLTEAEKRKRRCCFTGHRPQKLKHPPAIIKEKLGSEIRAAIYDGYSVFITGMAPGVDMWAAEIVTDLRDTGAPIKLICAIPFEGFDSNWSAAWRDKYHNILERADLIRYICPRYSSDCFQKRNEWMVDHAARVIAVYNGEPSGTRNTIRYAQKNNIPIVFIDD